MDSREKLFKEVAEKEGDIPTLGLDDTFEFTCRTCGRCCKNRDDILLSAFDVFRLAKFFKREPEYIIERYCEVYIGRSCFKIVDIEILICLLEEKP